jgi:hypothetical protein
MKTHALEKSLPLLTGTELFGLALADTFRERAGEQAAFTDSQWDAMGKSLANRPQEAWMYDRWWEVAQTIHVVALDARRIATECVWLLTLIQMGYSTYLRLSHEKGVKTQGPGDHMLQQARLVEIHLDGFERRYLLVKTFGEMHGYDLTRTMQPEHERLERYLTSYRHFREDFWMIELEGEAPLTPDASEEAWEAAYNRRVSAWPPLTPPQLPETFTATLQEAITHAHQTNDYGKMEEAMGGGIGAIYKDSEKQS